MPIEMLTHPSQHRNWVEVDLGAIRENVRALRACAGPGVELMPAVKADAYGHGAVEVSRAALAAGAARLGVGTYLEGEELRRAGIAAPIQILGAPLPEEVEDAVAQELILSLHDLELARLVSLAAVRQEKRATVHIKVDTGMGRMGFLPEKLVAATAEIRALPGLRVEGLFMHFAEAPDAEYSRAQLVRFARAAGALEAAGIRIPLRHAANTAGMLLYPESRFQLVRPGLGLYGICDPAWLAEKAALRPALSWRASVIQVKEYPKGRALGYNCTFVTPRESRIAVLPLGYADGYMRSLSNRAHVLIRGERALVVGMVSMDYTLVDVTDIPGVTVGTPATLIGRDGEESITVEELAALAPEVITYEIPTRLGRRPGRCYTRGAEDS